jgi:large subunit ribosomal protein L32
MAVPKKKSSPSRRNMRRQFYALAPVGYVTCPNCLETKRPHRVCSTCGHYDGRQAVKRMESAGETAKA